MELRRGMISAFIRTEGGLPPADFLLRIAAGDPAIPGLREADYGVEPGLRFGEAITRSWNRLDALWDSFAGQREGMPEGAALTGLTRDRWLLPLFEELGFGRPSVAGSKAHRRRRLRGAQVKTPAAP
jgi:hypothetical protein